MVSSMPMHLDEPASPEMKPADWPHESVFVQAGSDMEVFGINSSQPLPLGVPFEIESPLFKGKFLLRFRNVASDDPDSHSEYFNGRKRHMQTVIQGRFKRRINMSDVYVGTVFSQPLAGPPPPLMSKVIDAIVRRVAPGLVLDLSSKAPKVLALLAGTAQTISIDREGSEPNITVPVIKENVGYILGKKVATKSQRRKVLSSPKKAALYEFDTEHVYTFHTYDDAMDYGRGTMHLPVYGEYDIKPMIGRQPWSLSVVTNEGNILSDLRIWYKCHVK